MGDFQNDMNQAVQSFVAQIAELARRAAIDTLESAFGAKAAKGAAAAPAPVVLAVADGARSSGGGKRGAGRGAKRSAEDLDALAGKFAAFVKANPGLRIEQINKELGTSTKDLALPIRKLVSEGVIRPKGEKRSTTYFPGRKSFKR